MLQMMSHKSFLHRLKLVKRWGFQCIVCGNEFESLGCVTIEHIIPRSAGGGNNGTNTAPSHWRCNKIKQSSSLMTAFNKIERVRKSQKSAELFLEWLNKLVPSRIIPMQANLSPRRILELDNYHDADSFRY